MSEKIQKLIERVMGDVPPKTNAQGMVAKELLKEAVEFTNMEPRTTREVLSWCDGACAGLAALDKTFSLSNYMMDVFERFMEENKS